MPRRHGAERREILADPKFNSELISKFINSVMKNGKKSVAEKIVYDCLERLWIQSEGKYKKIEGESEGSQVPSGNLDIDVILGIFNEALDNIRPRVEVRPRRVGGSTYQIPAEVRPSRSTALAMRWLIMAASQRKGKTMSQRIAAEVKDACENKGAAVKRREDMHRMAKANQAFAHFRFT